MAILNYTTKISAGKTVGEIQESLVLQGARKIMVDYNGFGNPSPGELVHIMTNGLSKVDQKRYTRLFDIVEHRPPAGHKLEKLWKSLERYLTRINIALAEENDTELSNAFNELYDQNPPNMDRIEALWTKHQITEQK